jgi:hypothetical protein
VKKGKLSKDETKVAKSKTKQNEAHLKNQMKRETKPESS